MSKQPSLNGNKGRFPKGNPGGPGNPHARAVHRLRSALLKAITPDDVKKMVAVLIRKAKKGDVIAIKELLDRTVGRPSATDTRELVELRREADRLRSITTNLLMDDGEDESHHAMASFVGLLAFGHTPAKAMKLLGIEAEEVDEWIDVGRKIDKGLRTGKSVSADDAGAWLVWRALQRATDGEESGAAVLA